MAMEIHLFLYGQPVNNSAFFVFPFPRCLSFGKIGVEEETVGLNP